MALNIPIAPIVKGYFAVATEIFNDSGCPHTLEHLVFMGSDKYPYKGVLDNLANRAFSAGTNAWTDTDNTVYTIETAGQQGFLQLLPIYVDHILYPTMNQSAFITEVHHIDGKGEDSGVVYSEMQGRENQSGDLMALRHVKPTRIDTISNLGVQKSKDSVSTDKRIQKRNGWTNGGIASAQRGYDTRLS
jgi:Zn-dependent M16 (insulinase) family peptidase